MKKISLIILCFLTLWTVTTQSQTAINSLAELKNRLDDDNGNFVMTPGTYHFNAQNCGPGKLFDDPRLLLFTGNNSTFDFTGVKFEIDTEIFTLYGSTDIIEFWPVGSNNTYKNLTLEDIGMTVPTKGAGSIHLDGADNLIEGFKTTVRGSFPYGYGDTFGKGGGSVISHQKHAGILVRGDRNHLKNCTVIMRAYGHGIFMQGSHDAIIEGCYIEGELRTVGEMLQEEGTDSPADNVDFETVWGFNLKDHTSDYTFSLQEAGIRAYSTGKIFDAQGNNTGVDRQTMNTTVIGCTIVKMRVGVNTGAEGGNNKRIENCTALACEGGFWLGNDGDVINCFADASVGPILSEDIHRSNATYEVTILDNYIPKIGDTPYFFAGGTNHNLTIHDGTTFYNPDIKIVLGGSRKANRFLEGSSGDTPPSRSANNITLTNNTKYPLILEDATDCIIYSCGPVTDNGTNNTITNLTNCSYTRTCNNTAENLQAECYDNMFGIQKQDLGNNNEQTVAYVHSNDWISFNGIDMTEMSSVNVNASSQTSGGTIEVREGSTTGTLLASIPISSTSNWSNYQEFSANLTNTVSGNSDLYFVFTGGSGYLFNLDKISFAPTPCFNESYNPFLPIPAEDFCDASGVTVENLSIFNDVVGDIENNDYIKFSNVNFGYDDVYNTIDVLASSATTGGIIEVRSGAVNGTLLASITVQNTGGWNTYKNFSAYTTNDITGTHDIYLVFTGTTGSLLKIDNLYFYNDQCKGITYDPFTQVDALSYCEMFGVVPINNDYLGGIHDGDWIRYGSVDFGSTAPASATLNLAGLSTTTGYVNIMLDHPSTGTLIATATVPQTGGWEVWQEVTVPVTETITGIHEVYIYFGNDAYNMDWFQFSTTPPPSSNNIALGKPATQSSTGYSAVASRAVDGDTNGNWGNGSVTHTNNEANPWWEVDLGGSYTIDSVKVYNRTDCCMTRLTNYTVTVLNGSSTTFSQSYTSYPNPSTTTNIGGSAGTKVRIQLDDTNPLALAEVEVYGTLPCATFSTIEAEAFTSMSGIVDEGTNIGYIHDGDWAMYSNIDLTCAANIDVRASSSTSGGNIEVRLGSTTGILIGTVPVTGTGSWGNYATFSDTLNSVSGTYDVYLVFTGGSGYLFNIDWLEFSNGSAAKGALLTKTTLENKEHEINIFPNPTSDIITIKNATNTELEIYNIQGVLELQVEISEHENQKEINLKNLKTGVHFLYFKTPTGIEVKKIIKN